MTFTLSDLPYSLNALEPMISEKTLSIHHGKHHQGYITKVNKGLEADGRSVASLPEIFLNPSDKLVNAAAQAWNHEFYWHCMAPEGGGKPGDALLKSIDDAFGDFDAFSEEFKSAAATQFGSGWAWLVLSDGKLEIVATGNAENPLMKGKTPLLTIDVWEHAYYLDYQNKRPAYIEVFLEKLINWHFVEENYEKALS